MFIEYLDGYYNSVVENEGGGIVEGEVGIEIRGRICKYGKIAWVK